MAIVYTEMHVFLALYTWSYEDYVGQRHSTGLFHAKMKVNTCTICEIGLFTEEDDVGEIGFWQFHVCHCNSVLYRI